MIPRQSTSLCSNGIIAFAGLDEASTSVSYPAAPITSANRSAVFPLKHTFFSSGACSRSVSKSFGFGRGFGVDNLELMRLFYQSYPPATISESLIRKSEAADPESKSVSPIRDFSLQELAESLPLSWTHYVHLIRRTRSSEERSFYEAEALRGGWSVRQLDRQIGSQFYTRALMSRNKRATLDEGGIAQRGDAMTPEEAIKDPYVLEFLDLKDEYSETQLEEALIQRLEDFLLELGGDFTFVGRQRRLRIGDSWFRVDLLFFHRRLRCLVIIDLKLTELNHADVGQMHMYCNYAKEHWTLPGENPPVGLILCARTNAAIARYALEGLPNKVLAWTGPRENRTQGNA
ncbi:PDDEXK nuclease domain-containing protein [Burkholderia ubonensis]|uniref:PDDEXK nuclease domain-containing protein n=1 Tax=Burkholderia ubonensis TaxID=101571 RepID=UPI001E3FBE75|nr:PDDEXK nuclease domain-containing protein [Burkholderia ubonensis]